MHFAYLKSLQDLAHASRILSASKYENKNKKLALFIKAQMLLELKVQCNNFFFRNT